MFIKNVFFGEKYLNEINFLKISNYNQKTLPDSQFLKLNFEKKLITNLKQGKEAYYNVINKINENLKKKFFILIHNHEIILLDATGTIIKLDHNQNFQETLIKNNIKNLVTKDIKDAHIINDKLYITYSFNKSKNCDYFRIARADLNQKKLAFKIFFDSKECNKNVIAGKMSNYIFNKKLGLLVTTGSDGKEKSNVAQMNDSFYGKILFFDIKNYQYELISKGHRNPQGLLVFDNKILSTEHGPKGGDEINLIEYGANYGWPIASYGEPYDFKIGNQYKYKKSHSENNFIEPIYSFVPSIGISQIINIPKNFNSLWHENFLLSSLNGRSLYRIKFDKNYKKIIFKEKLIIGERIRDLVYFDKISAFLLALEDTGSIGILKIN